MVARYKPFIKEWREWSGLTQAELGERVGVSGAAVSRWESGEKQVPMHRVPKIAETLGLTHPSWLHRHPDTLTLDEIERATTGELREKLVRARLDQPKNAEAPTDS